jgi:serine/threonine protein kinase
VVAPTGRRLGRYHLVEPVGAGPCGEVFRAKVLGVAGMERQFAIKRFYPAVLARPEALARLQQATRAYGGLEHPRIARLAELGVAAGETFTATELVAGLDLARLVAMEPSERDRIPAGAGLGFVSAAARAMGYAHGRGVTHGGLCPTNLIATLDGDVKVTDVGVLAAGWGRALPSTRRCWPACPTSRPSSSSARPSRRRPTCSRSA